MTRRTANLLVAAAVIAGAVATWTTTHPASHTARAEFSDAAGLAAGNDVRENGVIVGSVTAVSVETDAHAGTQAAAVRFTVDDSHWPLRQGTVIRVTPRGVLSEVYVDVIPGPVAGPALPGTPTFDLAHTVSPVHLDALTNVFQPDVLKGIRTQIEQGDIALGDGGAAGLSDTITNAPPLLADALPTVDVLAARTPELDRLNTEFATISGDLAHEDAHLRGLIAHGDTTLAALAAQQPALQGSLDNAAATLTQIDRGLQGQQTNLRTIFNDGPQTVALTAHMAQALVPLVSAINPHVSSLDQLLVELTTATGFTQGTPGNIDTLRTDGSLPPAGHTALACGGEPSQQATACPGNRPSTPS